MIAYHGSAELKATTLATIAAHRAADEIAKGAYVRAGLKPTYCAVGCILKDPDGGHERYESELGIPAQLAWLEDSIFEALPDDRALDWPGLFMGAIPVGADLSTAWPRFAAWMMVDPTHGVATMTDAADVRAVCERVADAYLQMADGYTISDSDAQAITDAAWAARDAWDARDAWAAWAARDARDAWAAWAAWAARDARAARAAFTIASADKLVEILAAAPVR